MTKVRCGERLAQGRTSDVYQYGRNSVVKIPRAEVPAHWPRMEAERTEIVRSAGIACARVEDLVTIDGRDSIVFERIVGPSLWDLIRSSPNCTTYWATRLAAVQEQINSSNPRPGLPQLTERTVSKILAADDLTWPERLEGRRLIESLPVGHGLCHGDLHPGNVLVSSTGPIVIDWFDAAVGPAVGDAARTSLLVRPPSEGHQMPQHLPQASTELLRRFHVSYIGQIINRHRDELTELLDWERGLAAGRLAEQTSTDQDDLLMLWRSHSRASPLFALLDQTGTTNPQQTHG